HKADRKRSEQLKIGRTRVSAELRARSNRSSPRNSTAGPHPRDGAPALDREFSHHAGEPAIDYTLNSAAQSAPEAVRDFNDAAEGRESNLFGQWHEANDQEIEHKR